ncbi:MAG: hypothetical protein WCQ48_08190, partial [Chloroflexota bacterium]
FSRQHCREALQAIEKALNGDSKSTTGYRLDWRFYHQKALVHLGGPGEGHAHLDLERAGECAAKAIEFAASGGDLPGASVSCLTASWVDYCGQRFGTALDWALRAIQFDHENSQADFQAAKVLMASGKPQDAVPYLLDAVRLDRRYVLRVGDDGDFLNRTGNPGERIS